jgi:hypothetical protein
LAFKERGHGALKDYISTLVAVDPATLNRSEQFALLANLYNAKTIDIVLENYPVKSIKDISLGGGLFAAFTGGPWKAKVLKMKGVALSLDDIEHGILRPTFRDPRVHYAVNCASVGCPNLGTEAFTGESWFPSSMQRHAPTLIIRVAPNSDRADLSFPPSIVGLMTTSAATKKGSLNT